MSEVKLSDIADESGKKPAEVLAKAKELGYKVTNIKSAISEDDATSLYDCLTGAKSVEDILGARAIPKKSAPKASAKSSEKPATKADSKASEKPAVKTASKASEKLATKSSEKASAKAPAKADSKASEKPATKAATKTDNRAPKRTKETAPKVATPEGGDAKGIDEASTPRPRLRKVDKATGVEVEEIRRREEEQAKNEKELVEARREKELLSAKLEAAKKLALKAESIKEDAKKEASQAEVAEAEDRVEVSRKADIKERTRGLSFVRKAARREDKPKDIRQTPNIDSLSSLLGERGERRLKKERAKKEKHLRTGEQKMDLLSNRMLGSIEVYDEDSEVMLFDLNDYEYKNEEETKKKQVVANKIRVQRHSPYMSEGSISRKKSKRRSNTAAMRQAALAKELDKEIVVEEGVRLYEFADLIGKNVSALIAELMKLGEMKTKNDFLDKDYIEILANEFNLNVKIASANDMLDDMLDEALDESELTLRAPVVTIMGHVDHGKTTLLDKIRDTKIADGEAGGITQHIGAYMIRKGDKEISFIDTPGHEAFTEMRSRGAKVTDIAIIVIAADDGIKQQTIEALDHAKAANVQIIIAVNKIDKENANIDNVKSEASNIGFVPLDWGGEYEFIPVSARTGEGIDTLLDTILLQAEVMELRANPKARAKAVVLESSLEKGRGPVATIIVQNGTLNVGDSIVADTAFGRARALINDENVSIDTLGPSGIAVVSGLNVVPQAGSFLYEVESDAIARERASKRAIYLRQKELSKSTKVSFDELSEMVKRGQLKTLPVILKADTQGSLEAIAQSLSKLKNDEVKVEIIAQSVGSITQSDILLSAASSNCVILGFNVRPTGIVKTKAKELGVEIKSYSIIYALIDDIKALLSGMLAPTISEEVTGNAEVREIFKVSKIGTIAGCFITDGVIMRASKTRLIRDGIVIHDGEIAGLKRFKDDVKEVAKGYDCGITLVGYDDIKVGDVIEAYKEVSTASEIEIG